MRNRKTFVSFDVESVGLLGEPFAFGYAVYVQGKEILTGIEACPPENVKGEVGDLKWVKENCPSFKQTCNTSRELIDSFWEK